MTALDVKKWGYFQIILDLAQNDVDLSEYQRKFTQNAPKNLSHQNVFNYQFA
jgi:hypothetical protein